MFFDPSAMTMAQVIAALRDIGFLIGMISFPVLIGWRGRKWIEPIIDFFKEAKEFMKESKLFQQTMSKQMNILMTNHLHHIQGHLETLVSTNDVETVSSEKK